ncbi:MAG: type II secretion system F family protein [Hyphomicrobiaceae bacterium]
MVDLLFSEIGMALFAALAIGGVVMGVIMPLFSEDRRKNKRLASVTERRSTKIKARADQETASYRKKAVADSLKEIEERQNKDQTVTLRLKLQRAGLFITEKLYWTCCVICGVVVGLIVFVSLESGLLRNLASVIAVFVGTFGIPKWYIAKRANKRQVKFLRELANSMDVIVRGVKSGLPLNECLQIVAREAPEPVCTEFKEVVDQQRVGVPLGEALERMTTRMPLPEVRFLAIVIGIQQSSGGNLSEALGNLSGVLRDRIKMQLKVKALSSEAKASTMVLASLPPFVGIGMYIMSRDYFLPLLNTTQGHFVIAIGVIMNVMGLLVMRKMINFKY